MSEGRSPNGETDWQAIDIFVFSNGQEFSPPRKYHLNLTADYNLWKTTLNSVAKTQYGSLRRSVDLYTLEGRKLAGPLELCNGASYVAVAPQDVFVDAGYEKYLIRASRSWEKRQARKTEDIIRVEPVENGVIVEEPYFTNQEESLGLNTIESSTVNPDTIEEVKPRPVLAFERTHGPVVVTSAKPRSSIPRPAFIRKVTPPLPLVPTLKPSFKKRDSIKSSNVKVTRPQSTRQSLGVNCSQDCKLIEKTKTNNLMTKTKGLSSAAVVLTKVREVASNLKTSSMKITTMDGKMLSTNSTDSTDLKSTEDKELVLISNLNVNPHRDLPSIAVNPILSVHEATRQLGMTTLNNKNASDIAHDNYNMNSEIKTNPKINDALVISSELDRCIHLNEELRNNVCKSDMAEKLEIGSVPTVAYIVEQNTNSDNKEKNNTSIENISMIDLHPQKHSITTDKVADNQYEYHNISNNKAEINLHNEVILCTSENNDTSIKIHNSLAPISFIHVEKSHDSPSTVTSNPLIDESVAILNKSNVVNFKFKIEVETFDGSLTKRNGNPTDVNICRSTTNIHAEKGSQIDTDEEMFAQNKSLLSLITTEVKDNIADSHHVIIIQGSGCKFCKEQKVLDKEGYQKYIVILPVEKIKQRCFCSYTPPDENTMTMTSFMFQEKITEPNTPESQAENRSPNTKVAKEVVSISRKKSVIINNESIPNAEESSKTSITSQQINNKTRLHGASIGSVTIPPSTTLYNNMTQTNWCDTLLEARNHEDGHYTFRLPSLELLKYHRLT